MKKTIIFSIATLFTLSFFTSCVSLKNNEQKGHFITQFFNKESVYNSLESYYPQKNIIIYDEKRELVDTSKLFGVDSKKIKIETEKPINDNYFSVYSFILNKNLSMLVLSTSDGDKGVIYYIRKKDKTSSWAIMNIIPQNSR